MIIILEGPDGAGKTTLAEKLSKQTGYPILHRSHPNSEEEKQRMMDEYLQVIKTGKNCIFDRAWYSEMVYGPVMRDAAVISYPQMYALEEAMAKCGGMVIYCTAAENTLWRRCQERGEDYITSHDDFHNICVGFETIMRHVPHHIPVLTYEYKAL